MILKPRNREELVGLVKALPEEKRKVIVLVGRHPNEGTINIAVRHHKEWEEHGAIVVRIPAQWTPHGFWRQVQKAGERAKTTEDWRREKIRLKQQMYETPDDSDVTATFIAEGIMAPIVNFHGTGGKPVPFLDIRKVSAIKHVVEYYYRGKPATRLAQRRAKYAPKLSSPLTSRILDQLSAEYLEHETITKEDLAAFNKLYSKDFKELLRRLQKLN